MDVLLYRSKKMVTRSKLDREAVQLLDEKTVRVNVDGVMRYATPLLWVKDMPGLHAPKEAVLPQLKSTEWKLDKNPKQATAYQDEVERLLQASYISYKQRRLSSQRNRGTYPTMWFSIMART